jgi:hypothetical protein
MNPQMLVPVSYETIISIGLSKLFPFNSTIVIHIHIVFLVINVILSWCCKSSNNEDHQITTEMINGQDLLMQLEREKQRNECLEKQLSEKRSVEKQLMDELEYYRENCYQEDAERKYEANSSQVMKDLLIQSKQKLMELNCEMLEMQFQLNQGALFNNSKYNSQ